MENISMNIKTKIIVFSLDPLVKNEKALPLTKSRGNAFISEYGCFGRCAHM